VLAADTTVYSRVEEGDNMGNALRVAAALASACVFSMHAGVSNADSLSLSDIRTRCSGPDGSEEFAFCRGYVAALVEGVVVKRYPDCIPPMVNDQQFALLMRKYLNANLEDLQGPAVDGIPDAVAKIFKCNTRR
jgi:hypothetical protein